MTQHYWLVTVRRPDSAPHQPKQTPYRFYDEGQARMFVDACKRGGDRVVISKHEKD